MVFSNEGNVSKATIKRKHPKKSREVMNNKRVSDNTDSDTNAVKLEDNGSYVSTNTRKRRITVHEGKKNNLSTESVKSNKIIPVLDNSGSDPDINSPSQEIHQLLKIELQEMPSERSETTPKSCSCASFEEQINSLKDFIKSTMDKHHETLSIQMSQLGSQMADLRKAIKQLETPTAVQCDVNSHFENHWKLFPCSTKEEFEELDERLQADPDFREKLAQKFINLVNKRTTIVRNIGEILRFCLTRDLALKFNPVKASEGKLFIFVNTNLYNVIKASLLSTFSSSENRLSESEIVKSLSNVLHHCRDWEGGRIKRKKKITAQTNEDSINHVITMVETAVSELSKVDAT